MGTELEPAPPPEPELTPQTYAAQAIEQMKKQTALILENNVRTKARDEEWMTMVKREVTAFENIAAILDRLEKRG